MASITTRKNGSRFITFHDAAGNPRHITLGQVAKRYAEAFKVRVEDLAAAALHGHSPTDDTSRWLSSLEDRLYAKLAAVGLVPERQSATIGTLVERYIAERKDDLKPESTRKLRQTETKLLAFFDKDKSLRKITAEDATAWRRSLKDLGLSEAAIRTHCGNVKTMLGEAKRRKTIDANPFDTLKSGPTPSKYTRYITPDEIQRVIDACPDAEWRLLFGLARYAGLRISSESHRLTWADVDFERARLTVHSPKTERWEGHDQRVVPITPKLMALLRDRFETMPEGETPLVTIGGKGAVIRRVRRIWAKASVEPWARLWQTLRSSCEKEWAMTFPQFAVSRWIGHSITISGKHYANAVPDELFERAAKATATKDATCAQRQAQRKASDGAGNERKQGNDADHAEARNSADFRDLRLVSASPGSSEEWSRGELNPRAGTVSKMRLRVCLIVCFHPRRRRSASSAAANHPDGSSLTRPGAPLVSQPEVIVPPPIGRRVRNAQPELGRESVVAVASYWLCVLFYQACTHLDAQHQAFPARSKAGSAPIVKDPWMVRTRPGRVRPV